MNCNTHITDNNISSRGFGKSFKNLSNIANLTKFKNLNLPKSLMNNI